MHTVYSSHAITSMSSSLNPGLSPNLNSNRKSSASHERKEVKKRSRKRKNSLNRYGSLKKRRQAYALSRIKGATHLDSSLSEPQFLSNGALDLGTQSNGKSFQEPLEQNENSKFAGKDGQWRRKGLEVHADSGIDKRITSCSQAAQLDNAEIVFSSASSLPRTNTLEPVQSSCDGVDDMPEGRVLRPRRVCSKDSKENLPPSAESLQIVGRRVEIYWPLDAAWYCGLISAYDDIRKRHKISYDDGEEEWLCLSHETFKFEMSSKTESGQADGTVQENKLGKIHGRGSSNGSSIPITSRSKRPRGGSLGDTRPQADTSVPNLLCTEATLKEKITGLKAQKRRNFFLRRHKGTQIEQSRAGAEVDGDHEVKTGHIHARRQKYGGKERSRAADKQTCEDIQQVKSGIGQKLHERLNRRWKAKHSIQTTQQDDDAVHLCLSRPQGVKNLDSTPILDVPVHGQQPKLISPRKRTRPLKHEATATQLSLEGSVYLLDSPSAGTVGNAGVSSHCKSERPRRKGGKKHKLNSLAHTTLAVEVKKEQVEALAKPFDREQNEKAVEGTGILTMAESFVARHEKDARLLSHQETVVTGAGISAADSSRGKYSTENLELQAAGVSKKRGRRKSRWGRKPTGSYNRGYHKYRRTLKKSQKIKKLTSSNKLLGQSMTVSTGNEILVTCNESFACTEVMRKANCMFESSVLEGNIMHHWVPHECVGRFCTSDLILESNSSLHLQCPSCTFHVTIHLLRPGMVFGLFTWQLFNVMEAAGLFKGNCFEGRFSWMGSTRDLANVVILFMVILKSLPLTSQRYQQHWQGRVVYELWSVLLRREHWGGSLPAIFSAQAKDLLIQHIGQMIEGHYTSNATFRQMLNILSCYILKPLVIAILCEKGVQLTAVVQQFLLLTCPLREAISFERQSVKWVKLRSHAGAEVDFLSYLLAFPTATGHFAGTHLFAKSKSDGFTSARQSGYAQQFIPIPSFEFSSKQGLQFTTATVEFQKKFPRGGQICLSLGQVAGSFGAGSLCADSSQVFKEARELLLHGKFACFNRFQEFQDLYTRLRFNSMLQKCLYLAPGRSAEIQSVEGAHPVADKGMIYRQLSVKVDSVREEDVCDWEVESSPTFKSIYSDSPQDLEKNSFRSKSRKATTKLKSPQKFLLEESNLGVIKEERFFQNCDHHVDEGAVSSTPMGSSPLCSMNDLVYNASGSSSSSSSETTTKWKSTKMADIGFRPIDLRDQHEQGVFGNSNYFSPGQHSKRRAGPKRRPRGAEQESMDTEHLDLCCTANVLITRNNRSWREVGIHVELQSKGSEWGISVQIAGASFYHKVLESTVNSRINRYTHAVMWKGDDDWTLEFSDRAQWARFKGMHEECSSRNARAAFVKQIPIPSVKQLQSSIGGKHVDCPRFGVIGGRWPGEVETALNCSTRVYDMDSEDENWLAEVNRRASTDELISIDGFERIIDKLERVTYLRQGEMVATDEVTELCGNLASENAVLLVHSYWFNKRLLRQNALIRYFESPLWRKYQKQCDSWEERMSELQQSLSHETKEELEIQYPKPLMFAFCLPSRGLDASNPTKRVQRQRSQRHLNSSFKYTQISLFGTPEESPRVPMLKSQRGHDSLPKYPISQFNPSSALVDERGDFWQRKMSQDGFFDHIASLSLHTAAAAGRGSLEDAQANAANAKKLAQVYFLRFNSALQRAVAAVLEFETMYFAELAVINLNCESAIASSEQVLCFRRRMEDILNQFFSLSGKEDLLNGDGSHRLSDGDGGEGIDEENDDHDPFYTINMQADGFGGSPMSDDFLREEGSFLSIAERAHLESWMRTTLRQRAT